MASVEISVPTSKLVNITSTSFGALDTANGLGTIPGSLMENGSPTTLVGIELLVSATQDQTVKLYEDSSNAPYSTSARGSRFSEKLLLDPRAFKIDAEHQSTDLYLAGTGHPKSLPATRIGRDHVWDVDGDSSEYGSSSTPLVSFVSSFSSAFSTHSTGDFVFTISDESSDTSEETSRILRLKDSGKLAAYRAVLEGGESNARKVPSLGHTGLLDDSMLSQGVRLGNSEIVVEGEEALTAGDFVHISLLDFPRFLVVKADASNDREAHGFVLQDSNENTITTAYLSGVNDQLPASFSNYAYLSTTAGGRTSIPPSGPSDLIQTLGRPLSTTSLFFDPSEPIKLA